MCRLALAFMALALLALPGCSHYHLGSLQHPQLQSIALGEIHNESRTPELELLARNQLRREFVREGNLALDGAETPDAILHVRVLEARQERRGAARIESRDEDQEVFQSIIFGVVLTLEYEVEFPGQDEQLLKPRRVTGRADFDELVDQGNERRPAYELAMTDAARKIVANITEAW